MTRIIYKMITLNQMLSQTSTFISNMRQISIFILRKKRFDTTQIFHSLGVYLINALNYIDAPLPNRNI